MDEKSEILKIDELKNQGYTSSYKVKNEFLIDLSTNKEFSENQIEIIDEFRFEGRTNPDDLSILYAIKTSDGSKGTALIPYGPSAVNSELALFLNNISLKNS